MCTSDAAHDSLNKSSVALLVVDEVHCISVWGLDFRPDYRRLIDVIQTLPATLRVLGTTATATERIIEDIRKHLGDEVIVQRGSLLRRTLRLQNISMGNQAARLAWLAENIPQLPRSGVVYVLRKQDAEEVTNWLKFNDIEARAYYAGVMPSDEQPVEQEFDVDAYRIYLENLLINNQIKVLVATIALGMGFDKPDLGFVVHFQVSLRLRRLGLSVLELWSQST